MREARPLEDTREVLRPRATRRLLRLIKSAEATFPPTVQLGAAGRWLQ